MSTSNTLIQTSVPDEMRGRVMGVWALIFGAMVPIGSLEAGALAHWIGTPVTIGFGAIVSALAALVTWLSIRNRPSISRISPVPASATSPATVSPNKDSTAKTPTG
jgi:sugar phosphate permease